MHPRRHGQARLSSRAIPGSPLPLALVCLLLPLAGRAEKPLPTQASVPRQVLVLLDTNRTGQAEGLTKALQGQFSDVPVALSLVPTSIPNRRDQAVTNAARLLGLRHATALAWVEESGQEACILLATGQGLRLLCRTLSDLTGQAFYEASAILFRDSVKAVLEGSTPGQPLPRTAPSRSRPRGPGRAPGGDSGIPGHTKRPGSPASRPPGSGPLTSRHQAARHQASGSPAGSNPRPRPGQEAGPHKRKQGRSPDSRPHAAPKGKTEPKAKTKPPLLRLGLGYGMDVYAPGQAPVAHGIEAQVELLPTSSWVTYFSYRVEMPLEASREGITLAFNRHILELGAGLTWPFGRLHLGVRLGMDLVIVTRRTETGGKANAVNPGPDFLSAMSASAALSLKLLERLRMVLLAGARVYVLSERYQLHDGSMILEPWQVQPSVRLLFDVDVW